MIVSVDFLRDRRRRDVVLHALHLCSGYGGFELALRHAGIDARTVAHVERDAYAAATLVARMEGAQLDRAPVWSDLTTFDTGPWAGRVDLVTAGFPCQPFSAAGQQRGTDDDRHLWPAIARIIGDLRPRFVLLENVRGVVRAALPYVLGDLAQLGFDAEWGLLSAADIGAPHKRERWWCLAYADSERSGGQRVPVGESIERTEAEGCRSDVGHAGSEGRPEVTRGPSGDETAHGRQPDRSDFTDGAGEDVADTAGIDEREPHHKACAISRQDTRFDSGWRGFPPRPDDTDAWDRWDGAQPAVRRSTDGATEWLADSLHLGGNGLVPQCAAAAITALAARAGVCLT